MAHTEWVQVRSIWCDHINATARLMEKRVFPHEVMPDLGAFIVAARKCSAGDVCNADGVPCKWAYTNPNYDPFEEAL
ncbi:MAG: hypothetical protein ACE5FI_03780 [Anaerolineales bacterium]